MPFASVVLQAGVNSERTKTLLSGQAGYSESRLARFRDGLAEKMGGWVKYHPDSLGSPIRALHAWEDLNGEVRLAIGAEGGLQIKFEDTVFDASPKIVESNIPPAFTTTISTPDVRITDPGIYPNTYFSVEVLTPVSIGGLVVFGSYSIERVIGVHRYVVRLPSNAAATVANNGVLPTFTTAASSTFVSVKLIGHGLIAGDTARFPVATTVGGLNILGSYLVQEVDDEDTFRIAESSAALTAETKTMNDGLARLRYSIVDGPAVRIGGYGFGAYGEGPYGIGAEVPPQGGDPLGAEDWSLDNFGQILISSPQNGSIYQWAPDSGLFTSRRIPEAPSANTMVFVAMPQRCLVALGASTQGLQDPLLVRYSSAGTYDEWTAQAENSAGSYRVPTGSKIVGGCQAPQQVMIWTDIDLYTMVYIGGLLVWGFNKIMTGCGLIGRKAFTIMGTNVFWMSAGQFWVMGGGAPQPIPCPVADVVFQNLDTANAHRIRAASNANFNEVMWFYPSLVGGGEVDSYVKVNLVERAWDYGLLARSAWVDSSVLGTPIGGTPDGFLYQHEIGYDADTVPMISSVTTGFFFLGEGQEYAFVDLIIPDFKYGTYANVPDADVKITVYVVDHPSEMPRIHGPYVATTDSAQLHLRARGRQMALKFESSDLASFWRCGRVRYRFAPDGRM
jgi:hypothetical protein